MLWRFVDVVCLSRYHATSGWFIGDPGRALLAIPVTDLMQLRFNPFFFYIEQTGGRFHGHGRME